MKDLQILWSAFKYHLRRFTKRFKAEEYLIDDEGNCYYASNLQRVLYWRAYHRWQKKRFDRGQCNIGTDLFEQDTNISDNIKK
jgi:hypothetical protein